MEVPNRCWVRFWLAFEFVLAFVNWSLHANSHSHGAHEIGTARCGAVRYGRLESSCQSSEHDAYNIQLSPNRFFFFWCDRVTQFKISSLRLGCLVFSTKKFLTRSFLVQLFACMRVWPLSWFQCSRARALWVPYCVCADFFFLFSSSLDTIGLLVCRSKESLDKIRRCCPTHGCTSTIFDTFKWTGTDLKQTLWTIFSVVFSILADQPEKKLNGTHWRTHFVMLGTDWLSWQRDVGKSFYRVSILNSHTLTHCDWGEYADEDDVNEYVLCVALACSMFTALPSKVAHNSNTWTIYLVRWLR